MLLLLTFSDVPNMVMDELCSERLIVAEDESNILCSNTLS
jgi:hypothetical protein